MNAHLHEFSDRIALPCIPEGPGIAIIEDSDGNVLQITSSNSIRRRIGQLLDSEGRICVHGPKVYAAQTQGKRIYVRWKLTQDYKEEKRELMATLSPLWAP